MDDDLYAQALGQAKGLPSDTLADDVWSFAAAWLRGSRCHGISHTSDAWGHENLPWAQSVFRLKCDDCGDEGTELARFQRRKKP